MRTLVIDVGAYTVVRTATFVEDSLRNFDSPSLLNYRHAQRKGLAIERLPSFHSEGTA